MSSTPVSMISGPLTLKDCIPIAIALGSYLVGMLHSTAENMRERGKALNSVIHSLLEMRWEIKTSNPSLALAALQKFVQERLGSDAGMELSKPEVQQFVRQLFASFMPGEREGIGERYTAAVQTLAPFYPLTAHLLSAGSIIRIDARIREHYDRLRQHPLIAADAKAPAALALLEDRSLIRAIEEAAERLSADLEALCSRCGPLTRLRIRRAMREQDTRASSKEFYSVLEEAMSQILTGIPSFDRNTTSGPDPAKA